MSYPIEEPYGQLTIPRIYTSTDAVVYGCEDGDPVGDFWCGVFNKKLDPEPDLYTYNVAGLSGQFVYGPEGALLLPFQHIRINPTSENLFEWTITSKDGVQYIFGSTADLGVPERHPSIEWTTNTANGSWGNYRSSWYLREIRSPHGDILMSFHYTNHELEGNAASCYRNGTYRERSDSRFDGSSYLCARIFTPALSRIETPTRTVRFVASSDRRDEPFGGDVLARLARVDVETASGEPIKSYILEHEYFNDSVDEARRLRLESIREISASGDLEGRHHSFDYVGDDGDPGGPRLPKYGSHQKDIWGYFNNTSVTYLHHGAPSLLPDIPELGWEGADREPNPDAVTAGLIRRITYPTGGYTKFDFEANEYSRVASEDISLREWVPREVEQNIRDVNGLGPSESTGPDVSIDDVFTYDFTVNGSEDVQAHVRATWTDLEESSSTGDYQELTIRDDGGDQVWTASRQLNACADSSNPLDCETWTEHNLTLPPGGYTLELKGLSICESGCQASWSDMYEWSSIQPYGAQISLNEFVLTDQKKKYAGGTRVRQIQNYTADGHMAQKTIYKYNLPSEPDRSSGVLVAEPVPFMDVSGGKPSYQEVYERSESPVTALGATGGQILGYSHVRVVKGVQADGGNTLYHFATAADPNANDIGYPSNSNSHRMWTRTSRGWKRGVLLESSTRDASGNLLKKKEVEYDFNDEGVISHLPQVDPENPLVKTLRGRRVTISPSMEKYYNLGCDGCGRVLRTIYVVRENPYVFISGLPQKRRETITTYGENGAMVTTTQQYDYVEDETSPALGQLRSRTKYGSNVSADSTSMVYAHECNGGTLCDQRDYSDMGPSGTNQIASVYQKTVFDVNGSTSRVLKRMWTTWRRLVTGAWIPAAEWVWNEEPQ
jgi:hypothetical protein